MTSIKTRLNMQRLTKNGYPVVIQIINNRQKSVIYTPYYLKKQEFDIKNEIAVTKSRSSRRHDEINDLNNYLKNEKTKIELIIARFERLNEPYDAKLISHTYRIDSNNRYFETYVGNLINQMIQQGQNGTAMAYQAVLKKIKSFYNGKHLILDNINNQMVMDFKVFLKEENHKKNTINFYMRIFRAIYNKAMNDGYIETGTNPFRNITFHTEVTPKRAITKAQLRQIVEIDLSDEPHLECARDIFLFSFFTRGMPFVDCAYLKKTDIRKDTIEYSRRKTDQKLSIEISPQIESIVNKYTHINNYVLPILDNNDPRSDYEQYRNALRKHNIRLQIIGDRLGIKLSSYVTRHSWATIAKNKGIPLSVISESLGHASESTTYAYLASFDKSILREANEIVTTL